MPVPDFPGFAILLIGLGLFSILAVRLVVRVIPRTQAKTQSLAMDGGKAPIPDHGDGVLIVEAGGRILSINAKARQIFHLQEEEVPNLERMARKVRPSEALFNLCAFEGQASFSLEGRLVEASSYLVSTGVSTTAVVSLRHPEIAGSFGGGSGGATAQRVQTFTELTQAMAASLDLRETLESVLENVSKILPADFLEITLWDAEAQTFLPYRLSGLPGSDRLLSPEAGMEKIGQGFLGKIFELREPLLVVDVETRPEYRATVETPGAPLRSLLGVPLMVGNEATGVLAVGSMMPGAFGEEDLDLMQLLSGQAATALHNALLYRAEKRRSAELSGLAQLAQAFSSARNPAAVFAHLVESIVPLLPVEVLGFLVYNENQRVLAAQPPFHGLPNQIVQLYQATVAPGSAAEQILLDQDLLITENAETDEKWAQLGLDYIAQAASLRETVLVPLSTGGHMQGYLQASNHTGGSTPFNQAEMHFLMIVANQTASIIENITLVQQSRQRALRAEALRRITSLASSAATLEEILQYSLQELARLLHSGIAVVFLLDQEHIELTLHPGSAFGEVPALPDRLIHLVVDDPQFPFSVTGSQHILSVESLSQNEQAIIPFYQEILRSWQVESLIAVPLVIRDEGIGEIWFGSTEANLFDQGDVQVVATAAGQLAGVVEQSFLLSQTDESLRRRVDQMVAMTRISRELSTSLDLHYLMNLVYDEALRITRADCGTILLFDLEKADPSAVPARFFVGDPLEPPFSTLEAQVLENDAPVRVADFSRSAYKPPHPQVQSALVVPIMHQQKHAGLICLHGKLTGQFDDTAVEITLSLAVQAAVALNNALAYEEQTRRGMTLKRELETLSRLIQVSRALKPSQTLEQSLREIARAIQLATPFQVVLINLYDPESKSLRRLMAEGVTQDLWEQLRKRSQSWQSVKQLLQPEFKVGEVYYIPEDRTPVIPEDVHIVSVLPASAEVEESAWHQLDLLLIPLFDQVGDPLGLISVDAPVDNRRPDRMTFDALEVFAAQASIMVESHQRARRLERQVVSLEEERTRLQRLADQVRDNLPAMLHKELEQAIALHGLGQRIERARATLDIASRANRQPGEREVLLTLASEMLTRFAMQYALIAEKGSGELRLVDTVGSFPAAANPDALFGQRNPLRQILLEKSHNPESSILYVSNLDNSPEWQNNTLLKVLEARSLIGMQLDMGKGRLAGVLVLGQRTLPALPEEDRQVFAQLSYQVSVGLQNLQLLNETRRRLREVDLLLNFSRKLGSLQPADIFHSLVDNVTQVLPAASAGWAGTWDEKLAVIVPQAATGYVSQQDLLDVRYSFQTKSGPLDTRVGLPLEVFRTRKSARVGEVDFTAQYRLSSEDLLRYRRATNGKLPISALVVPLQVGEKVLGVLFLENFEMQDAFSNEDEELAASFSRQATMALENARLYQASEQRAAQLQALTMVAGTITSSLQQEELISSLLDQLRLVLPYDTATLWLRSGEMLRVAAATGFADRELRLDLSVSVSDSALFNAMIQTGAPISIGDLRSDHRFPSLLEPEYLSWLGIPLIYKSEVIGLIAMEKREADYFTPDHIQAGTTFAGQAAVSLENARLYAESTGRATELDERSQRLALLNRLSGRLVASLDVDHILRLTAEQLLGALGAAGVAAAMIDQEGRITLQNELPERASAALLPLPPSPFFDYLQQTQGIFQTGDIAGESGLRTLWENFFSVRQARSLLVVPLVSGSAMQGWFLIFRTEEYRYTLPEIELARTMCNQSAIAVQNARLFVETRRLTADLEQRVEERTRELRREHQNSQTLLHIITELSTSLEMSPVLNRTLAVLNESVGSEESIILLSHGDMGQFRSGIALVQEEEASGTDLSPEYQISQWVVRSRQPVLVARVQEDERWVAPQGVPPAYQSVLGVPLIMGEEVLGSLLLFHREPDFFSADRLALLEATARQIGIALNHAELFNLIRDQSEHLGGLLREQQIEASRSRALLEAVADGVLVTDAQNRVTLLNGSAERILKLEASQAIGEPLEGFSGLFGSSALEWMQTIHAWSQSPVDTQNIETFAEQLDLDNGRVIAVHLAPVFWRQEFLGTVSIFRDITHEVQVDRLKSEFITTVSHELRTPLTSIKGYVEILLMGAAGKVNPQQENFLNIVKSNTIRLGGLVDDLLDISRIEAGYISFRVQPLNLSEIAGEVIADLRRRSLVENRPFTFHLEAQPGLPCAQGDQDRVRQVFSALVTNGYSYTHVNGCVRVVIHQAGSEIQVDVIDNGIGITPQARSRVFERFYRGEDPLVLASAGTGMGLAIAKTLVEMHNGRIWFESSGVDGEGSTFSFTLPVYEGQEQA